MAVPNPTIATGLTLVALDTSRGSANNITATLTGGSSYYVAVMDFAGVPTRYSLCMTVGRRVHADSECTLLSERRDAVGHTGHRAATPRHPQHRSHRGIHAGDGR